MDGFELYQKIRKIDNIRVYFLTSADELCHKHVGTEIVPLLDVNYFLQKSISNKVLKRQVNKIIDILRVIAVTVFAGGTSFPGVYISKHTNFQNNIY
jgi:hypothetical protein